MPDVTTTGERRGKGRPRCFDRDKALLKALEVFWRYGYELASISELCKAMEINPPSLYATFGNKTKLFLEAVDFYEKIYWAAPSEKLLAEPDLYKAIDDFFMESARILTLPGTPCGCMIVLSAINISDEAIEVIEALAKLRHETKEVFAIRLRRAQAEGQLSESIDIEAMAATFNTYFEGLSLQARGKATQLELEQMAAFAVRILPDRAA